ncbi:MAG: hypothetical protein V1808_03330 [Candidatus Daviesbacteria bacterium]
MNKKLITLIPVFVFACLALLPVPTYAQYGGPEPVITRQFYVDKKIYNPNTQAFVDNLGRDQMLFQPGAEVLFRITVTNTGSEDLTSVVVTDHLPDILTSASGNTINFTIDTLKANTSQTFDIKAQVRGISEINANVICPSNLAEAKTGVLVNQDTSTFCVQKLVPTKGGIVAEELPKTGLPLVAWGLAGLLPVGLKLKKMGHQGKNSESDLFIWQKREFNKES